MAQPGPSQIDATIESLDFPAADVARLIVRPSRSEAFPFRAGQYAELDLGDGVSRSFSIACAPNADGRLEFHIRVMGADLEAAIGLLKVGGTIAVAGPQGLLALHADGRPMIMVAGGTGFAPIKALTEQYRHERLATPLHLYWGARSREDLYLASLAEQWVRAMPQFRYTPVLSAPKPADGWSGRTGWVHDAVMADYARLDELDLYAAGPPQMIVALRDAALAKGLPPKRFFSDFAALD